MVQITREALLRNLRKHASRYNEIVAEESFLKAEKEPLRNGLVAIMDNLGTDTISVLGLKVSVTRGTRNQIDRKLAESILDAATLASISKDVPTETLRVIPDRAKR